MLYIYIKIAILYSSRAKSTTKNFHKTTISNEPFRRGKTQHPEGGWGEDGAVPGRGKLGLKALHRLLQKISVRYQNFSVLFEEINKSK